MRARCLASVLIALSSGGCTAVLDPTGFVAGEPMDGGSSVDAGSRLDARPRVDTGPLPDAGDVVVASVFHYDQSVATASHVIQARFYARPSDDTWCTIMGSSGPCEVTFCDGVRATSLDAGTLTVTGSAGVLSSAVLASWWYYFGSGSVNYPAGEPIHVAASGGAVPAFGVTLPQSELPTVTVPSALSGPSPYSFTWSDGLDAQYVEIVFQVGNRSLSCRVPASDGRLDVPAGALGMLESGGPTDVAVRGYREAVVAAGSFGVRVRVAQVTTTRVTLSQL